MTEVIEHVAHPDDFLAKTAALVKPGGVIVMTTPNGAYFRNRLPRFSDCVDPSVYESGQFKPDSDGHIFLLHPDEVHALAGRAGLVVDELVLFTNPLTNGHLKTAAALKVLPRTLIASLERAALRLPWALRERVCVQLAARAYGQDCDVSSIAELPRRLQIADVSASTSRSNLTDSSPMPSAEPPRVLFLVEGFTDIRFVVGLSQICNLTMIVPSGPFRESGLAERVAESGAKLRVIEIPGGRLRQGVRRSGLVFESVVNRHRRRLLASRND